MKVTITSTRTTPRPSWDELVAQAHTLMDSLQKPAAPSQPPTFIDLDDLDPEVLGYAPESAECDAIEAEAIDVYLGKKPLPKALEWAASLTMDDFVEAYATYA
jgi:hypothetical protein